MDTMMQTSPRSDENQMGKHPTQTKTEQQQQQKRKQNHSTERTLL